MRDPQRTLEGQYVVELEDRDDKNAFKTNLFSILTAIQSINLCDHFKRFATFECLSQQVFEDLTQPVDMTNTSQLGAASKESLNSGGVRFRHDASSLS